MKKFFLLFTVITSFAAFAQKIRIVDNKLVLNGPVLFKDGTAELLPESYDALKNAKLYLDEKTFITTVRVEGHVASADAGGSQTLSEGRAMAVVKWLVKEGVDCKRLLSPLVSATPNRLWRQALPATHQIQELFLPWRH